MIPVSSAAQVRSLDAFLISDLGLPGIALMEIAARGVAEAIRTHHPEAWRGTVVVCGPGNNGGDGYAIARWLHGWGATVRVVSLSRESGGDAGVNRALCRSLGITESRGHEAIPGEDTLIVDAVFGTGLTRPVDGSLAAALREMARHPAPTLAVDLPSGLCADTGAVLGFAVPAVRTVTLGRLKPGLLQPPGHDLTGVVEVVDLGLDVVPGAREQRVAELSRAQAIADWWPCRSASAHKHTSGHLLVVAGSTQMAGAGVLTCPGAHAAGAGLVTLATPRGALERLGALPPEVMVLPVGEADHVRPDGLDVGGFDAVAAGPGLGGGEPIAPPLGRWLEDIWAGAVPAVFDADALGATSGAAGPEKVLTPHPGEAARCLSCPSSEIQADRLKAARALASQGAVALLKGRHTVTAAAGGVPVFNPTGHPVLATAGSGDVLTGVVGALLARGVPARRAAIVAAWVHGRAGEILSGGASEGWTASGIAGAIPAAVAALRGDCSGA